MSVSIKKIQGVEWVNVSLNKGLVSIKLAPGNKVSIAEIRKAILNDGFTPKNANVVATGKLLSRNGKLRFAVVGTNETFPVVPAPRRSWRNQAGRKLTVKGLLAAPAKGTEGGSLQITGIL